MLLFRRMRKEPDFDHIRLFNQIAMVQVLLDYGYNWDQINDAIGFSEEWFHFSKRLIEKHRK